MIVDIFPTPIYINEPNLEEKFAIKHEVKKAIPQIVKDGIGLPPDREANLKTNVHTQLNTITKYNLNNLAEYIKTHVKKYMQETECYFRQDARLEISRSWINVYDKKDAQEWHSHGDSLISGTYYVQFSGDSKNGQISFRQPGVHMRGGEFPIGNKYQINMDYTPVEGGLILFPGWLEHRVRPNETEDTRISISFDCFVNVPDSKETIFVHR